MIDRRRLAAICLAGSLTVASCGQAGAPSPASSAPTTSLATATTGSLEAGALTDYREALARTVAAESYRFDAEVELKTTSGRARVELRGWVDGVDRELVVRSGGRELRTVVEDGVATVYGPDGPSEVPLSEAAEAPSLSVLEDLEGVEVVSPGEAAGTLEGGLFRRLGIDRAGAAGPAEARVFFTPGGMIERYLLQDPARNWWMRVSLFDVGAVGSS